jgi:hypothetical protein
MALNKTEMEQVIAVGGSVLLNGRIITKTADLPTDPEITSLLAASGPLVWVATAGGVIPSTAPRVHLFPTAPCTLNTLTPVAAGQEALQRLVVRNITAQLVTIPVGGNVELTVPVILGLNHELELSWDSVHARWHILGLLRP